MQDIIIGYVEMVLTLRVRHIVHMLPLVKQLMLTLQNTQLMQKKLACSIVRRVVVSNTTLGK
ncbi:MAG: hypothetical protein UHU19_04535 [Lachnospiraceae bacterium]|nr:hypothetical protein [Lachnospiraceae bacterium]